MPKVVNKTYDKHTMELYEWEGIFINKCAEMVFSIIKDYECKILLTGHSSEGKKRYTFSKLLKNKVTDINSLQIYILLIIEIIII